MDINVTVNIWFLVSLCLACMLIGGWLFRCYPKRGNQPQPDDFYEYQRRPQRNTGYQRGYPKY